MQYLNMQKNPAFIKSLLSGYIKFVWNCITDAICMEFHIYPCSTRVCLGFLYVPRFHPNSQKHASWRTGDSRACVHGDLDLSKMNSQAISSVPGKGSWLTMTLTRINQSLKMKEWLNTLVIKAYTSSSLL